MLRKKLFLKKLSIFNKNETLIKTNHLLNTDILVY